MMNRIFGFLSCAWAGATALKSAAVAISSDKPLSIMFRFILWFFCCYLVWVPEESLVFPIEQEAAEEIEQLFSVLSVCRVKPVVRRAVVYPVYAVCSC